MPPKINAAGAAQYAQVDPAFIAMMKQIWKKRWSVLNGEIKSQDPRFRSYIAKKNAPQMSRLKALCTSPIALDKELTRLRGLSYERFYIRQYNEKKWMVGLTRPIVMSDGTRLYQAPRYFVYVPEEVDTKGTEAKFHFIPEGHELVSARHPHHKAQTFDYNEYGRRVEIDTSHIKDPLDWSSSTCWGSFGTIASNCIAAGDIVDLYRNLYIYLTRIDQSSLLTIPFSSCYFLEDIGPVQKKVEIAYGRVTR